MLEKNLCNNEEMFGCSLIGFVIKLVPFCLFCWPSDQPRSVILVLVCRLLPVQNLETDHIQGETKAENKSWVKVYHAIK